MLRESLGVVTEGKDGVFRKACVKQLFAQEKESIWNHESVRQVYVAIDPSGGGPSHFAIASVLRHQGKMQVLYTSPCVAYSEACTLPLLDAQMWSHL